MSFNSVEALLDPATDAAVRAEWEALLRAGLSSQASHRGPSNAPHVTLCGAPRIPSGVEEKLGAAIVASGGHPPLTVRLGPLLVLGSRRPVLARLVLPTPELLRLQADVAEVMAACDDVPATLVPGHWAPHVTLARGLHLEGIGSALAVLDALGHPGARDAELHSVRRWDPDARRVWELTPRG